MRKEFIISAIKLIQDKNPKSVNVDDLVSALNLFVGLTLVRTTSQQNHSSRTYEVAFADLALKFHCIDDMIFQMAVYDKIVDNNGGGYAWIPIM